MIASTSPELGNGYLLSMDTLIDSEAFVNSFKAKGFQTYTPNEVDVTYDDWRLLSEVTDDEIDKCLYINK